MAEKITSLVNQYRGVNSHLNSLLQTAIYKHSSLTMWPSFHVSHVVHIADFLNQVLPQNYIAHIGRSLHLREEHIENPPPEWDEHYVKAVMIYYDEGDPIWGTLITRIEVVWPSSKPGQVGHNLYLDSRKSTLEQGLVLVEIDYLHERSPLSDRIPTYPEHPHSHPYLVTVFNPRPSVEEGLAHIYSFDADEPVPEIPIPLLDSDTTMLNLNSVYNHTFRTGRWGIHADYSVLPERFHTFSLADQERIRRRMVTIADAFNRGLDLEQGPFPLLP